MKPLTLTALVVASSIGASQAASPLEFYGKANVTLQQTDIDDTDTNPANGLTAKDVWEVKSNASRFGVKGEFALSESLNAFYQFEWEVDVTDANDSGHFKARNQGVGLQGDFGRALVGRWDTPTKMLQVKIDLFNDLDPETKYLIGGKYRPNNTVAYSTPTFGGGFKFNVATVLRETTDNTPAATDDDQDGLLDSKSWSIEYARDALWVALSMDDNIAIDGGAWADGAQLTRLAAQYKLNQWTFGALWQKYDDDVLVDDSAMVLSVAFKLDDSNTLKFQHASSDIVGASTQLKSEGGKQDTIGYDHLLAKNVSVFAFYSKQSQDLDDTDRKYLAGGIEVKF